MLVCHFQLREKKDKKGRRGEGERKVKDRIVSMVRDRERQKGEDGKEKGGKKGQLYKVVNTKLQCVYSWLHTQYGCVCLPPNFLLSHIQSWLDLVMKYAKPKCFG